jgi:hypothetical protein
VRRQRTVGVERHYLTVENKDENRKKGKPR